FTFLYSREDSRLQLSHVGYRYKFRKGASGLEHLSNFRKTARSTAAARQRVYKHGYRRTRTKRTTICFGSVHGAVMLPNPRWTVNRSRASRGRARGLRYFVSAGAPAPPTARIAAMLFSESVRLNAGRSSSINFL